MNEELKVIISAEISKLKQNVENAKQNIKGFQEQVKKASADVDKHFAAIGTSMANGAKAAATGLAAAGTALLALGASTAEYRAEQAKLVSAFEAAGSSAEVAKETYNDLYRVLGDGGQATEAANHLAKLTTEEQALSEWTNICQGVYATFGDSLPIEGLTEAANETAKTGSLTGQLADALNWAGVNEEAFQEKLEACNSEAEREKLIRETLNGLYSEAASVYEENNAQVLKQNEEQAKLQETTAKLGEAVAPVVSAFTAFANEALAAVVPYVQGLAEQYLPLLEEVLGKVTEGMQDAFKWVQEHKTLLSVMGGIVLTLVTAIGLYNAVAAVKAAMAALEVTSVWGLVAAYTAQAAAMLIAIAPYVLIVAAIAAVIAIIVLCVKHWDTIKAKVKEVWNSIKQWTQEAVAAVVNKFTELGSKARAKIDSLKTAFSTGFSNMVSTAKEKASNILSAITEKFDSIKAKIKEKIDGAKEAVKSGIQAIVGFFTGAKFSWPKIPLPHFSVSPSGWKVGDLLKGSIPKLSISWRALGGVFDKPTLLNYGGSLQGIGENGAEMVAPLENNLEWLDKLANMLTERMGANTPVVLNVDGKVFAETAISTINRQTRQTGRLALNLV